MATLLWFLALTFPFLHHINSYPSSPLFPIFPLPFHLVCSAFISTSLFFPISPFPPDCAQLSQSLQQQVRVQYNFPWYIMTQSKLAGCRGSLVTTSLFFLSCAAQPGSGGLPLTWIIVGGIGGAVLVIGILVLLCVIIVAGMWITEE